MQRVGDVIAEQVWRFHKLLDTVHRRVGPQATPEKQQLAAQVAQFTQRCAPAHGRRVQMMVGHDLRQRRGWLPRFGDWIKAPVPAYGAIAAALVVFALAGAPGENRASPAESSLAAVADTSLPSPVLTRADSYNVLANIRLLDRTLKAVPLLTDSLDRAILPGTQL